MSITVLLARIFGPFLLITALMAFGNRKVLLENVEAMFRERFAQWVASMIALLGGIAYVNLYHDWSSIPSSVLSAIGWFILTKGLLYAFLPQVQLAKFIRITEHAWYTMDGIFALVFGLYLTGFGFGIF